MEQKTIEGTWEEVAKRAPELAGRRVRVTVLEDFSTAAAPGKGAQPRVVPGHLIDHDAVASCEREADAGVTLDEVRAATSVIRGSMAQAVIEGERAERF